MQRIWGFRNEADAKEQQEYQEYLEYQAYEKYLASQQQQNQHQQQQNFENETQKKADASSKADAQETKKPDGLDYKMSTRFFFNKDEETESVTWAAAAQRIHQAEGPETTYYTKKRLFCYIFAS